MSSRIGAEYGERCPDRVTQRNGYRSLAWDTRVGTMDLHIPKLREGSYVPSLLEPRRRSERALLAVIQQATWKVYPQGGWTIWSRPWGVRVSPRARCRASVRNWDVVVDGFLGRPLDAGPYPYLWLDALTQKVREDGRIVNVSVVVATAVNGKGKREIIGWTWVPVKTAPSGWPSYARCPSGPQRGGAGGIGRSSGTPRRHRRSLRRSQLATVPHPLHDQPAHSGPRRAQPWVATMVRTIYQQPSPMRYTPSSTG